MNVMRALVGLLLALSLVMLGGCQAATQSEPANQTAAESHLTFRSTSKLQDHFEKHGADVGCTTPEEYVACANAVISNPNALHKTQREDGDDAYFLEDTGEFVVVSQEGYIRTYFITNKGYFNKQ